MESTTERYGTYYWCIKVTDALSKSEEIYIHADRMDIDATGALLCIGHSAKEDREQVVLGIAAGQWRAYYAASVIDGSAIAVEFWLGEVIR